MPLRLLKDIPPAEHIKAIFKGRHGTLKTSAAVSFPKPMLLVDFDQTSNSVKVHWPVLDHDKITVGQYGSKPADFVEFRKMFEALQDNNPYRTIILDSLTSYAKMCINYSIMSTKDTENKREIGVIDMPGKSDFGGEDRAISTTIDICKELKCHVILIAHVLEWEATDPADPFSEKTITLQTLLTGGKKVAAYIPTQFQEIYHFTERRSIQGGSGTGNFEIITRNTGKDFAKTALGLPEKIEFGYDKRLYPRLIELAAASGLAISDNIKKEAISLKKGVQ